MQRCSCGVSLIDIKDKIQQTFNAACPSYDEHARLQKKTCAYLIEKLAAGTIPNERLCGNAPFSDGNFKAVNIADLGCGTGCSTASLRTLFPDAKIIAVDFAQKALDLAQAKIHSLQVEFLLADFEEHVWHPKSLHLVFSNMSLQWSLQLSTLFKVTYESLESNGLFAFSLPLEGNFPEILDGHKNIAPPQECLEHFLKETGFKILWSESTYYREQFTSPLASLLSLKKTGASVLLDQHPEETHLNSLSTILVSPTSSTLTYHIGFFIAKKEG